MFHKIPAHDLRVGMFVVDTGVSWLKNPLVYSVEGQISSELELKKIHEQGFREAFIDLTRCGPGCLPPELASLHLPGEDPADEKDFFPTPPKVPLVEEMLKARSIYRSSLAQAKDLMDSMRKGQFSMPAAEPVVEDILESLDRNVDALVGLCKLRQTDDYTYTHCVNVSVFAVMFARGIGISGDQLHAIGMGGLFHDLGKSLIPLRILNAPRKLSDAEFEIMRRHPLLGFETLRNIPDVPAEVLQITLEHHEKHNGLGYPNKLAEKDISIPGRIAAVVDIFDALSSRRVYKEPMPTSKALSIMYSMRDKDFAPGAVERFIRLLGIYPVGSAIELEDGSKGVVSASNPVTPIKPTVMLVRNPAGGVINYKELALTEPGSPAISRIISDMELGADPGTVLGLPK